MNKWTLIPHSWELVTNVPKMESKKKQDGHSRKKDAFKSIINRSINQINQSTEGQYSSLRVSSRERGRKIYVYRVQNAWRTSVTCFPWLRHTSRSTCSSGLRVQGVYARAGLKFVITSLTHARGQNEIVGHHCQYWLIWTVCPVILYGHRCMLQSVEKKVTSGQTDGHPD